ncbi:hypothetical protein PPL19_02330 [Pseudomonas psychrotolerans L19]|nr:hypothetical protein PPL19_02330 [Pseudomonas psychrotolerans L19]
MSLTNPKLIIFFLALFPPFIQADRRCCRSWCC